MPCALLGTAQRERGATDPAVCVYHPGNGGFLMPLSVAHETCEGNPQERLAMSLKLMRVLSQIPAIESIDHAKPGSKLVFAFKPKDALTILRVDRDVMR